MPGHLISDFCFSVLWFLMSNGWGFPTHRKQPRYSRESSRRKRRRLVCSQRPSVIA